MTGFGKTTVDIAGSRLTIEVRALNSRQFDLNLKIPGCFRDREREVRDLLSRKLERGKIDLYITVEETGETSPASVNHPLAKSYHRELKDLAAELGEALPADLLSLVLKMPDVMSPGREEFNPDQWDAIAVALGQAVSAADEFRIHEGEVLGREMHGRVHSILGLLETIGPFETSRITLLRERLRRDFARYATDMNGSTPDPNRFEQELIYYLEKLDITEEKVRLEKHCRYFLETMEEQGSQGKKLGFIAQEMGREINTIGSKANDAGIQKIVVMMKDELEKIKEQLGNLL